MPKNYNALIANAIVGLKSRKGCSRIAIKKYIEANGDVEVYQPAMRRAIKVMVENGDLLVHETHRGSFVLSDDAKAEAKAAIKAELKKAKGPKKKKTTKKKTTKKKKKTTKKKSKKKSKKKGHSYRTIKGVKYDGGMLDAADEAVDGNGDGRVSVEDAKEIFAEAADGGKYTAVEKKTMKYIRANYKFTKAGDTWLRKAIASWAAKKAAKKKR
eukprot:CAMPEP_0205828818 /NCGR_PEP_ID=MMETSP0206-20130828/36211_1 /ASSEMBLY_ACC=CAM_ASM_000279 /TAXON_ID=36767 /ORGANISM="Euplotes focardii, Strain TN1" /LENGTH=212 /DNA_ID=CAMNT_0053130975 /DNA_START=12 /DNA_END=650 /DNA_ORIENTATION=+